MLKLPSAAFFSNLSDDFQYIDKLLAEGILAAYLLGYDSALEETLAKIDFAEGDDRAEKAGDLDLRFDVRPEEAVDYFRRKRILSPKTFNKLTREAKSAAFMVSGIYREDILQSFKSEIADALESGQTQKYVTKQFKDILKGAGHKELGDFHLESIIRSNMQTAYGVGRRKAMEETSDLLPFWEYSAVSDDRTRPTHRALDGIIYPANHEFWNTHYPPWGFNCRCTVIARLDMPEDYNRAKPNADTTIAYDADGLPAKAEYRTQVVDLKATNFSGVPKSSSLETALTEAANAAKDSRLLNHQNIPQVIVDKAREIRLSPKEKIAAWDKEGNEVGEFTGDKDEVFYPDDVLSRLDGGFDIHNHPPENGQYFEAPSDQDFQTMVELNIRARYVITRNYLYQVRVPKSGWKPDTIEDFYRFYDLHRDKIALDLSSRLRTGEMTLEQIDDIERHLIWKAVAKDLKFKYKRFNVSEL